MATRRGVLLFVLLAVVLGGIVLVGALRLRREPAVEGSSVLVFDVPVALDETAPPPRPFPFGASRRERNTLYDLVDGLDRAADDDHVEALVLHVDNLDWGWAKVSEVRDAILRFRASGKPVYASLAGGGEREYLLASAASRLSMPPTATLQLDGLSATATFYRGTFDKLGVVPNFAHVGRYKSAVEPYTRNGMSEDARAALGTVLDHLYGLLADSVASGRGMTPDSVRRLVDDGPYAADAAVRVGLLDTLLYDLDVDSLAVRRHGRRVPAMTLTRYIARLAPNRVGTHVALVTAAGAIVSGKSRDLPGQGIVLGSETIVEALREARTRRSIRAVVLRIDSPGGVAQASDDIWHEVERCRAVKPVIVSMSDYAASGGYYFAVAADSIVAQPATLTGSIGIFGGKLNVLGLYHKLGLNVETVSRGRHAEMLSPYRDFDADEANRFQASLEHFYRGFVARVAQGRRLDPAAVDSLGQGRVWSGIGAREHGLVDRLGGLDVAIAMARSRLKLAPGEALVVDRLPRVQYTFLERMVQQLFSDDDEDAMAALELPPAVRTWIAISRFPTGTALAMMSYGIEIR
jgi:protease IV